MADSERKDEQTGAAPVGVAGAGERQDERRLRSGMPRLDYILKGGLLKKGIYAVYGPPGGGKTIFGNQFCFNHVRLDQGRCVYMTLLVESHAKLLAHLRPMSFFDPNRIGDQLYYLSGYQTLKQEGLRGLLHLLRRTVKERRATLLVVDGLESTEEFAANRLEHKEFLHELQSFASLAECTTLLLATTSGEQAPRRVENTLVDGVIELSDRLIGPRAVRELTVHKFRGSDYLRGRHEVEITADGLQIHPRTEIQFDKPPGQATEERVRMAFGLDTLDEMLYGGIPSGSTVALLGAPGAGKTTLGLKFLVEGARQGQQGVYFGFYEPPPRLIEKATSMGIPLQKYVDEGLIELVWQPPLEHYMDSLAEQLLEKIRAHPGPRRRLFVDGVEGFRAASVYDDRMPRFLSALTNQLRMFDVTTLVAEELALFRPEVDMPNPELANVVETVILLRYVELESHLHRLISIMKMRESRYDTSVREFRIDDDGIHVAGTFAEAEAILTGNAHLKGTAPARKQPSRTRPAPRSKAKAKTGARKKSGRGGRR